MMPPGDNLPDWLRELRDQQLGMAGTPPAEPAQPTESARLTAPTQPVELTEPVDQSAQETQAMSHVGEFDALREKASAEPLIEERPQRTLPIIGQLSPFQRFVLALMLFLNVSVLGLLFLMVAGKITLLP
jgi:hypothetical protein